MPKSDNIEVEGVVVEALPNANFRVELAGGHKIMAQISGKIRMNLSRIVAMSFCEPRSCPNMLSS